MIFLLKLISHFMKITWPCFLCRRLIGGRKIASTRRARRRIRTRQRNTRRTRRGGRRSTPPRGKRGGRRRRGRRKNARRRKRYGPERVDLFIEWNKSSRSPLVKCSCVQQLGGVEEGSDHYFTSKCVSNTNKLPVTFDMVPPSRIFCTMKEIILNRVVDIFEDCHSYTDLRRTFLMTKSTCFG